MPATAWPKHARKCQQMLGRKCPQMRKGILLCIQCSLIACTRPLARMCVRSPGDVRPVNYVRIWMSFGSSLVVRNLFTGCCSVDVHRMLTGFSVVWHRILRGIPGMFIGCSSGVHRVFVGISLDSHLRHIRIPPGMRCKFGMALRNAVAAV